MPRRVTNLVASIKARLNNAARAKGLPFDVVLIHYALERILYRLSLTPHRQRFILKGAMLLTTWTQGDARFTRDLDLLGRGESSEENIRAVFADVFAIKAEDGLELSAKDLVVSPIREDMEYGGLRLRAIAKLDRTRIPITIDIGFGDAVTPAPRDIDYPSLLDLPRPNIRSYPPETVIAEKFQAVVVLGLANSRMKDYYDLWLLGRTMTFDGETLARAISATFVRRKTEIPNSPPIGLRSEFARDEVKAEQWRSYLESLDVEPFDLQIAVDQIIALVMPAANRAIELQR